MRAELFIAGQWRRGQAAPFESEDPALGGTVWRGEAASAGDVVSACTAARVAFSAWAATPLAHRVEAVRAFAKAIGDRAETLAQTISRETGKTLWESRAEAQTVIGKVEISIRAQAERAGQREEAQAWGALALNHRPHGVMAVFGPFNFPAHLPNGHIVPALLAGNTIVFKPSELAPGAGALMADAWEEAGLPPGVFNLVQGGREVGGALLDNADLNGVLFTGSLAVGAHIHRHFAGRPDIVLALEMGGNNPLIVWPPTDIPAAANLIAHSAFITTGQRCSCARRLIVPDDASGREIIDALGTLSDGIRIGAWNADPPAFMGPLVHARAAEQMETFAAGLLRLGGRAIRPPRREGAFVRPAVIDMTDAAEPPDEELFGPLLQIFRTPHFSSALARANRTRFGLSAGLISEDIALWESARVNLRAGVLNWNRPTTGASGGLPFGGPGLSGSARPGAYYAADYSAYPVATQQAPRAIKIAAPGLPT